MTKKGGWKSGLNGKGLYQYDSISNYSSNHLMGQRQPSGTPFKNTFDNISVVDAAMSRAQKCYQIRYMGAPI